MAISLNSPIWQRFVALQGKHILKKDLNEDKNDMISRITSDRWNRQGLKALGKFFK